MSYLLYGVQISFVCTVFFICYRHYRQYPMQVSELESQMESFEAEIESCQVKKGRNRPPRLVKILKRHQHLRILAFNMVHKF